MRTISSPQARALEAAGVLFIAENGKGPGVRLRKVGGADVFEAKIYSQFESIIIDK